MSVRFSSITPVKCWCCHEFFKKKEFGLTDSFTCELWCADCLKRLERIRQEKADQKSLVDGLKGIIQ